jgi:Flp pilus assembly protein TadD
VKAAKFLLPILACAAFCQAPEVHAQTKPPVKATPAPAAPPATDIGSTALRAPEQGTVSEEAQELAKQAMTEFGKGQLASAKRDFERVLQLAPGNLPTEINLGLIAYRQKAYGDAVSNLRKVVRADPDAAVAWLILGVIYYDQNKLDEALAALSQAALLAPKDARAHHFLGVTIGKKGWFLGAEDELRKAIELQPDYAEAHFNLAVFYLQRSPPAVELARRHYQKALDLGAARDAQVEKMLGTPKD